MWRLLLVAAAVAVACPPAEGRTVAVRRRGWARLGSGRWNRDAPHSVAGSEEARTILVLPSGGASALRAVRTIPLLLVDEYDADGNAQIAPVGDEAAAGGGSEVPVIYATPALLGRRGYLYRRPADGDVADAAQLTRDDPTFENKDGSVDINININPFMKLRRTTSTRKIVDLRDTNLTPENTDFDNLGISDSFLAKLLARKSSAIRNSNRSVRENFPRNVPPMYEAQNDPWDFDEKFTSTSFTRDDIDDNFEMSIEDSWKDMDPWMTWRYEEPSLSSLPEGETVEEPASYLQPPLLTSIAEGEAVEEPASYLQPPLLTSVPEEETVEEPASDLQPPLMITIPKREVIEEPATDLQPPLISISKGATVPAPSKYIELPKVDTTSSFRERYTSGDKIILIMDEQT